MPTPTPSGSEPNAKAHPGFKSETIAVAVPEGGTATFSIRRPLAASEDPVPVLIVLAGFKTNAQTLARLPNFGNNAVIAYHYDYDQSTWKDRSYWQRAATCGQMSDRVAAQVAAVVEWVKSQSWSDSGRVNLAGGSLGAIIMPMIVRELQDRDIPVRTVTMAYGGANRRKLVYLTLRHRSWWLAHAGGWVAWWIFRNLEPAVHLPLIQGEFLIISSPEDMKVPRACSQLFEDLTPEPKTIVHLDGEHLNTRTPEILTRLLNTAKAWLAERGAINP